MTYASPMHMCYNHNINTYCCVFSFKNLKTAIYRSEQLLQFGEQGFILTISKGKAYHLGLCQCSFSPSTASSSPPASTNYARASFGARWLLHSKR